MKNLLQIICFCFTFVLSVNAQNLSLLTISKELTENANACIRSQDIVVNINARNSMSIKTKRVVTVLNEQGIRHIDASQYYDKSLKILSIEAKILNSNGLEIKKIKRKDFRDQSLSEGMYSDIRILQIDYTPISYPFTVVFECEIETINTAFLPSWTPLENYFLSTENSKIAFNYPSDLGFKFKEDNFEGYAIEKTEKEGFLSFEAKNIQAIRNEDYAPSLKKFTPIVIFGLNKFHLEGVDGEAEDWKSFGKWRFDKLIEGTDELPQETKDKIISLVGNEKNDLKKAKIVYEYVQNKTRYVSIQMGIGGWKPMLAKDVDRLGYGDCKALTNYTRALLNVVGVDSYYTSVFAGNSKIDFTEDFVSMQGNHIILALPYDGTICWMECTSQTMPFGFLGDFTDDRLALIVTPEGGELIRTQQYSDLDNSQITTGNYTLNSNGKLNGSVSIKSKGTQYDSKYLLERKSIDELDRHYKNYFSTINNLNWKNHVFENNKEVIEFTEKIDVEAENYASKNGTNLMFALNAFNQYTSIPKRHRTRTSPFEISRGFYDYDDIIINLPDDYLVEFIPEAVEFQEKFGHYKTEIQLNDNKVIYKRSLTINKGFYSKSEYEDYRKFIEKIAKNDNAKLMLTQN